MSNKDQWNAPYADAVNEGVITKKGIAGEQPTKRLGGTLGTSQGGDGPSPNGANAGSLSAPANPHGTLIANSDPFITSIGEDGAGQVGVLSLQNEQKNVRVGNSVYGSGRLGAPEVTANEKIGDGIVDVPESRNIGVSQSIRNVGSRFNR